MKIVRDLDGKEYRWKISRRKTDDTRPRSRYHVDARQLLRKTFPMELIVEEVYLPGIDLYGDFYLPQRNWIIEVHGEQHYEFSSHFHKNQYEFLKAKERDRIKQEWCELNKIKLIIFSCRESINEWSSCLS